MIERSLIVYHIRITKHILVSMIRTYHKDISIRIFNLTVCTWYEQLIIVCLLCVLFYWAKGKYKKGTSSSFYFHEGKHEKIVMIVHLNPECIKKVNREPEMFSYAKELYVSVNSRVKFLFYVRAKLQESKILSTKIAF